MNKNYPKIHFFGYHDALKIYDAPILKNTRYMKNKT